MRLPCRQPGAAVRGRDAGEMRAHGVYFIARRALARLVTLPWLELAGDYNSLVFFCV